MSELYVDLPTERYTTVAVDPPWKYNDNLPGPKRGATNHYRTLELEEIAQLPVQTIAADNAHLYVWATNAFLPDALNLIKLWGFTYKTQVTWVKTKKGVVVAESPEDCAFGMGWSWRNATEHALFATRGKVAPLSRSIRNVIFAPVQGHSVKPAEFYRTVNEVSPGPRIDLFARPRHEGWDSWGDQVEAAK